MTEAPNQPFMIDEQPLPVESVADTANAASTEPDTSASAADIAAPAEAAQEPVLSEYAKQLIAEAEERGYLRGRNENIEHELAQRGIVTAPPSHEVDHEFLAHLRPSIWS